ncbi:MAG: carboxypeptidase-like regulatory domain-containing protein, partial [Maribacter sp.]|nr:carboxypeptidase-like regulatory domain-containing protein [Maribacter sp.]
RVTRGSYLQSFFLLPYYDFSTNKEFLEGHLEHDFKGFIMGKIPVLNWLKSNLVISGKFLMIRDNSPYTEFGIALDNLGWSKFRLLRAGFVQNHFEGVTERGFNLGISF